MLQIDAMSRTPVYEQIIGQMERFVVSGVLSPGERVPSVRNLSVTLGINPNTIQKAYTELGARGVIYTVPGKGYFVSEGAKGAICENGRAKISDFRALVTELAEYGLEKETLVAEIGKIYNEKGGNNAI